jgi:hypothetical protein
MDGDPAVDSELDTLGLVLPLPFRVGLIVVLAVWGWAINLHVLSAHRINVPKLIAYPDRPSSSHAPHHQSTYRLATALSFVLVSALILFWVLTRGTLLLVQRHDWLPLAFLVVLAGVLVIAAPLPPRLFPFLRLRSAADELVDGPGGGGDGGGFVGGGISATGRRRLRATLRRVCVGGLAEARDGKFGDILLADVLTSYAKVFGDLYVALCMFLRSGGSATARPDRGCGGTVIVPLIMAIPSAIRLRQCLIEFLRVRRAPYREATGWGGQHLANAAKYSTAFPVIILSALQRSPPPGSDPSQSTTLGVGRAWLAAVLLNSLYSFYWDVAKDWDLTLLSSNSHVRAAPDHPYGLRRHRAFRPAGIYYAITALDLVLRCTWALKLSPHLAGLGGPEGSIFLVEVLEVVRRWVWIFFRVETEYVRGVAAGPVGLGMNDMLLGDYQGKDDSDDEYA